MKHPARHAWRLCAPTLIVCVLAGAAAKAEAPVAPSSAWPEILTLDEAARFLRLEVRELEGLARRQEVPARRIGSKWRFSRDALLAWLAGAEVGAAELFSAAPEISGAVGQDGAEPTGGPRPGDPLVPDAMSQITAAGASGAADDPDEPIGEAPEERTAEDVFLRGQRVLLAPDEVTVDLGLFYSVSDNQELVLVNGVDRVNATVEEETFTTFLLIRVSVLEETEIFASTTYRDQQSDLVLGGQSLSESSRSEFGDLRLGLRRTLLHEGPGRPDIIATIDGRIPTGDTSYALGGGLAFVKSVDPAVLFASVNYRHTSSREFADATLLEPEDRFDVTLGYALALNDTLTISTAVSGLFTGQTEFANATLRRRKSFSFQFGLTSWLAEGLYIEPTVSFGLNGPGNSVVFGVTLPYTF